MATTIVSHIKVSSSRRKRSRAEFDAENIDTATTDNVSLDQPRKKARTMLTDSNSQREKSIASAIAPQLSISHTSKRSYSQTDFSQDCEKDEVLKECNTNKKMKVHHAHSIKAKLMMVDNEEKEMSEDPHASKIDEDEEGDIIMVPIKKRKQINQTQCALLVSLLSSTRRNRYRFPPNRIRRSGLLFGVDCGLGISA